MVAITSLGNNSGVCNNPQRITRRVCQALKHKFDLVLIMVNVALKAFDSKELNQGNLDITGSFS